MQNNSSPNNTESKTSFGYHDGEVETVISVDDVNRQAQQLEKLDVHLVLVQEHSADKQVVNKWRGQLMEKRWIMNMSAKGSKSKGTGVGSIVREPIQAILVKMQSKKGRRLYEHGKCAIYNVPCRCL